MTINDIRYSIDIPWCFCESQQKQQTTHGRKVIFQPLFLWTSAVPTNNWRWCVYGNHTLLVNGFSPCVMVVVSNPYLRHRALIIVSDQQNHPFYNNPLVHPSTARIPAWWPASADQKDHPSSAEKRQCLTDASGTRPKAKIPGNGCDRVQSRLFKATSKTCRTRWATSGTIFGMTVAYKFLFVASCSRGSPLVDEARPCACSRSLN